MSPLHSLTLLWAGPILFPSRLCLRTSSEHDRMPRFCAIDVVGFNDPESQGKTSVFPSHDIICLQLWDRGKLLYFLAILDADMRGGMSRCEPPRRGQLNRKSQTTSARMTVAKVVTVTPYIWTLRPHFFQFWMAGSRCGPCPAIATGGRRVGASDTGVRQYTCIAVRGVSVDNPSLSADAQ